MGLFTSAGQEPRTLKPNQVQTQSPTHKRLVFYLNDRFYLFAGPN